jgi:hypothetical protein
LRRKLAGASGCVKIGLVWSCGAWKPERAVPLDALLALSTVPNVALFSLQCGPAACAWTDSCGRDISSPAIVDAAAAMLNLDLIITVDTMTAHLAGALGVPVWTLLHYNADWRWLLGRSDSPWYPSMRLFRQKKPGEWGTVINAVRDCLRQLPLPTYAGT